MFACTFYKKISNIVIFLCMPLIHCAQLEQKTPGPLSKFKLTPEYKKAFLAYETACREEKNPGLLQASEQDFINFAIVSAFIDKVSGELHDEVRKSLQDKKLLALLDTFSTQQAYDAAEKLNDDGLMLKILSNNQRMALLSGPNGPLIMALEKTSGGEESLEASANAYLRYAQALYHQLDSKYCFQALIQASHSKYRAFIVAPLLTKPFRGYDGSGKVFMLNKGLIYKITQEQAGHLLFLAFSNNDKKTISALLDDEKIFEHINDSPHNKFFCQMLALPSNEAFDKPTRYLILYRLLKNENFLTKLEIGLQAFDYLKQQFQTMFLACAQNQSKALIELVFANTKLSKYLSDDVIKQAQNYLVKNQ